MIFASIRSRSLTAGLAVLLMACASTSGTTNEPSPSEPSPSEPTAAGAGSAPTVAVPSCSVMRAEVAPGFVDDLQASLAPTMSASNVAGGLRSVVSYGYDTVFTTMFAQVYGSSLMLADQGGQRDADFHPTPANAANVAAAKALYDAMTNVSTVVEVESVTGINVEVRRSPGGRIVCKHILDQRPLIGESWTCELPQLQTAFLTTCRQ